MGHLGVQELLIIAAVILVLFGGTKIPELAKGLGQGMKEFKHAIKEGDSAEQKGKKEE